MVGLAVGVCLLAHSERRVDGDGLGQLYRRGNLLARGCEHKQFII